MIGSLARGLEMNLLKGFGCFRLRQALVCLFREAIVPKKNGVQRAPRRFVDKLSLIWRPVEWEDNLRVYFPVLHFQIQVKEKYSTAMC